MPTELKIFPNSTAIFEKAGNGKSVIIKKSKRNTEQSRTEAIKIIFQMGTVAINFEIITF